MGFILLIYSILNISAGVYYYEYNLALYLMIFNILFTISFMKSDKIHNFFVNKIGGKVNKFAMSVLINQILNISVLMIIVFYKIFETLMNN